MAIANLINWTVGTGKPAASVGLTGIDTTGAQLIVVTLGYFPDNAGANTTELSSVADNKGNTYQIAGARSMISGADCSELWYAIVSGAGTGHTITVTFEGSTFVTANASAYNGFAAAPVLDQVNGATGSGTAINSGNVTIATADELLVLGGTHTGMNGTFAPVGASYTLRGEYAQSADNATGFLADRVVAATGTYNGTATGSNSTSWAARIATFKAGAGGGAATIVGRNVFGSAIFSSKLVQ